MKTEASLTTGHIPGLDALRAIAVLLVAFQHWQPSILGGVLLFGSTGVGCFFVLSGFLITAILLRQRGKPFWPSLMTFHWRRAVRIYPSYYALNIALLAAGIPIAWETAGWNFTYTTNLYVFVTASWIGNLSHFWSLAVEFQFYLFWPFIILLTPARWLGRTLAAIIALSLATRLGLYAGGFDDSQLKTFTLSYFDYFACGGLIAMPAVRERLWASRSMFNKLALACLALFIATGLARTSGHLKIETAITIQLTLLLVFTTQIVFLTTCEAHHAGWKRMLNLSPLRYLGVISYGFYLYHNLAGSFWKIVFDKLHMAEPEGIMRLAIYFAWTTLVSVISYHWFEVFFLSLKSIRQKPASNKATKTTPDVQTEPSLS